MTVGHSIHALQEFWGAILPVGLPLYENAIFEVGMRGSAAALSPPPFPLLEHIRPSLCRLRPVPCLDHRLAVHAAGRVVGAVPAHQRAVERITVPHSALADGHNPAGVRDLSKRAPACESQFYGEWLLAKT